MLRRRSLLPLVLIAGTAGPVCAGAGEHAAFVTPEEGAILLGPTRFELAVADGSPVERIEVYVGGRLAGTARPPGWSFDWEAPEGLAGVPVVAAVFAADGLLETIRLATSEATFDARIQVVAVELFPVVTDRRGRYVQDLGVDDFVVLDQGRRVEIETFHTRARSLSMAVMIDSSTSMRGKLGSVQEASIRFVDRLRADDRVAVYSFHHAVERHLPMSTDRAAARETIRSFSAGGGTALYDALVHALEDLGALSGRKAILLFSDGRDERSMTSLARVVEVARDAEVIVYAIGAGETAADLAAREDLELLARETGGQAHFIDRIRDLPSIYDAVLADLRAQYSLSYTPAPGPAGQRWIRVRVDDPGLQVRCRRSYWFPGSD